MERINWALSFLVIVFAIAIVGLSSNIFYSPDYITGRQSEQSTISSATIAKYVAISMSGNLSDGINFGNITSLPSADVNATFNYNSTTNQSRYANETFYFISLSSQSNSNADFCIRSTTFNTSGGASIDLGNYTWNDTLTNNYNLPNVSERTSLLNNNSYLKGLQNLQPGNDVFYRFWLNVTSYIEPGLFNSTVYLEAVPAGDPC